jgi:PEP-CTERM motif-containing protein
MKSKAVAVAAAIAVQLSLAAGVAHAGITAVPEPTTLGLLGVGAAVAAVGAWWRHRK